MPFRVIAIDLFAGLGGFTTGAESMGARVAWAANHWPDAVKWHTKNHPDTQHSCQDLHQADWSKVPAHDALLASPACQGHSLARGKDRPHHDSTRSTAWAVVSCAEYHRPPLVVVENVKEFATKWALYPAWCHAMRTLGYTLSPHMLDAADFGVPQNRERLYIVCTRTQAPFMLRYMKGAQTAIRDYIDWDSPKFRPIGNDRADNTLARIENGRREHGDRFVMPYYGNGSGKTGRSIDRPIGTITTVDRWGIVNGGHMRMMDKHEARAAMAFPENYQIPDEHKPAMKMLGNAVPPPVITEILRQAA